MLPGAGPGWERGGEALAGGWTAKPESEAQGLCGERISLCAVVCVGPQHRD